MYSVIGSSDVGAAFLVFKYDFGSGHNPILACRVSRVGSLTDRLGV